MNEFSEFSKNVFIALFTVNHCVFREAARSDSYIAVYTLQLKSAKYGCQNTNFCDDGQGPYGAEPRSFFF